MLVQNPICFEHNVWGQQRLQVFSSLTTAQLHVRMDVTKLYAIEIYLPPIGVTVCIDAGL